MFYRLLCWRVVCREEDSVICFACKEKCREKVLFSGIELLQEPPKTKKPRKRKESNVQEI